ncbi:MAG: hypothetical protein ABW036_11705, partial [Flavitalea sp.]
IYYSGATLIRKRRVTGAGRFITIPGPALMALILLALVYTLFAITNIVSFNDKVIVSFPIPKLIQSVGEIFRASGRFFWLPYYLLLFLCFVRIDRAGFGRFITAGVFLLAMIVQFLDIRPLLISRKMTYGPYNVPLSAKWQPLITEFNEVVFYPPFEASYRRSMDYQDFCFLAGMAGKPINTGYVARLDSKAMARHRDDLNATLAGGELIPGNLYITDSAHLNKFSVVLQSNLTEIGLIDDYFYLYSKRGNSLSGAKQQLLMDSIAYRIALKIIGEKVLFLPAPIPKKQVEKRITFNLEQVQSKGKAVFIDGWAVIDSTTNNRNDSIFLTLSNETKSYLAPAQRVLRPDVTNHFKKEYLDNAGFGSIIFNDSIEKGTYHLGIIIRDHLGNSFYQETGSTLNVGEDYKVLPVKVIARPDVSANRPGGFKLDSCGFRVTISKKLIPAGIYKLGLMIEDKQQNKKGIVFINKSITAGSLLK